MKETAKKKKNTKTNQQQIKSSAPHPLPPPQKKNPEPNPHKHQKDQDAEGHILDTSTGLMDVQGNKREKMRVWTMMKPKGKWSSPFSDDWDANKDRFT